VSVASLLPEKGRYKDTCKGGRLIHLTFFRSTISVEDVHKGRGGFIWGGRDAFGFRDDIPFTHIPYNFDLPSLSLLLLQSVSSVMNWSLLTEPLRRNQSRLCARPNIGINSCARPVNGGNVSLRLDGELLYKNLSKMKNIKRAGCAKRGTRNGENKYKYTLHGRGSNSQTPAGPQQVRVRRVWGQRGWIKGVANGVIVVNEGGEGKLWRTPQRVEH